MSCLQVWYTSSTDEANGVVVYGLLLDWPQSGEVSSLVDPGRLKYSATFFTLKNNTDTFYSLSKKWFLLNTFSNCHVIQKITFTVKVDISKSTFEEATLRSFTLSSLTLKCSSIRSSTLKSSTLRS